MSPAAWLGHRTDVLNKQQGTLQARRADLERLIDTCVEPSTEYDRAALALGDVDMQIRIIDDELDELEAEEAYRNHRDDHPVGGFIP